MAPRGERNAGLSLAAAGVGIMGASVVFGLTTDSGEVDWVGVIMATAGLIIVLTGLIRSWRPGTPHTG
jgi:cell shape-determining protein MreD